jgi:peptide/nickel transport system substrate-binding protein
VKRTSRMSAVVLAVVLGLTASACSSGTDSSGSGADGKPQAGGDLVLARAEDSTTMLPPETSSNADIWVLQQVYETLTTTKADGSGVEPLLATKWTPSEDGLTWTFDIRQGVTFHDGKPLTAEDVAWSLNYDRTESDTNQWASFFERITKVEATDDKTVTITLSEPWSALPDYLALFATAIYPKDFGGASAEKMRTSPDGTGPFKLTKWSKGQQLVLGRNDAYWSKKQPYLDSVTFTVVPDDNTRALQLKGRQIQINENPSPASIAGLSKSPGVKVDKFASTQIVYVNVNTKKPGLDDPLVRRALSYAIDREGIAKTVLSGLAEPAASFLSSGLFGSDDSGDGATYDLDLAKKTLAKSSRPGGLDISIGVVSGAEQNAQIAQVLKESWAKIGVKLTIKQVDATALRADRDGGRFDTLMGSATSDVVDPAEMVGFLAITDGTGIRSGYKDPEVVEWTAQLDRTDDQAERKALLAKIQQKVTTDSPVLPIVNQPFLFAQDEKVKGFRADVLGTYSLKSTWLSR